MRAADLINQPADDARQLLIGRMRQGGEHAPAVYVRIPFGVEINRADLRHPDTTTAHGATSSPMQTKTAMMTATQKYASMRPG